MVIGESPLEEIVDSIVRQLNPERIYLFGSRAKGTMTSQSDFDLLIVRETTLLRHVRSAEVSRLFPDRRFSLDVIVDTPDEFERRKRIPNTIQRVVAEEGVLLYERSPERG
ncbi:MAG: hypothetical protein GHCLOJNM_02260 [bacterium]|nr:hypothetical protein [bacterium]